MNNKKNKLVELNKYLLIISEDVLKSGNGLGYDYDFYILSIINRTISLNRAFILLLENENALTAISIVRLQLDSVMRLFAVKLATNKEDYLNHYFEGKQINLYNNNRKSDNFSDKYLVTELDKVYLGIKKLYKHLCDFVHFSDIHFEAIKSKSINTESIFRLQIGNSNVLNENEKKLYYDRITSISNIIVEVASEWVKEKKRLIEIHNNKI